MFKKVKLAVLAFLGAKEFAKNADGKFELTADQTKALDEFKGEGFSEKFLAELNKESEGTAALEAKSKELQELKEKATKTEATNTELADKIAKLEKERDDLAASIKLKDDQIGKLIELPEDDPKGSATKTSTEVTMDNKFLFGQQHSFMAIGPERPYNMRAYASLLARQGIMLAVPAASSIDYTALKQDLGDFYRIQKQQQIQSFLLKLPSLETIFPLESGYQDQAALVNLFMGEFSQADNTGSNFDDVVKGEYQIESEILSMYDVMFSHKFTKLKELEKTWIGYLNKEGSNTMKWSFIQYILVETGKALHNEQQLRRVKGVRKNPVLNTPGLAMEASNGLKEFLRLKIANFQIKPFALGEWSDATISDYIFRGTGLLPSVLRDSGKMVLHMSPTAVTKYHKNRETLYGLNQDYTAGIMYVAEYPQVKIVAVPGMDDSKRMIWTLEGNIRLFEDQPGEMYKFNIEQQDWTLKVWSNWKESVWAILVGKKFATAAEQDYDHQMIFCNDVDLGADSYLPMEKNSVTPSALRHTSLVSVANSQATALTDVLNVATGQEVRLKCGNATNAITIAAAGKFSLLTAAWTPSVGDVLILKKRSDGKFIELDRINAASVALAIAADDTIPDVAAGDTFVTNANTVATAITTLDNAEAGKVYTIWGAGAANATTIANAGNFVLTAAMTLSATHYIKLQKSKVDSKFYEIERA